MNVLSHEVVLEVLLLQAADDGRGPILFGDSRHRVAQVARPFMVGKQFPSTYLEFPLAGEPFLDLTLIYNELSEDTHIDSETAADADTLLSWYAGVRSRYSKVSFGFELDTKNPQVPTAAVHFQPRRHTELVEPFCQLVGEPERAKLYLDLNKRLPEEWQLSFFGMFRGRPGSPLRVCGYLDRDECQVCAKDPGRLQSVFDQVGFSAYDKVMLEQLREVFSALPGYADFQLDIFPDGSLGSTFAIDMQFEIEQPELVRTAFSEGAPARLMKLIESWGAADDRWRKVADCAFARGLPVELGNGEYGRYGLTLMPQWAKARWIAGELQASKMYLLASGSLMGESASESAG